MPSNYDAHRFAQDLRTLLQHQPGNEAALDDWYRRVQEIVVRLEHSDTSFKLPPGVWRWLHDADLRMTDPDYDRWCTDELLEALRVLDAQPPGTSG